MAKNKKSVVKTTLDKTVSIDLVEKVNVGLDSNYIVLDLTQDKPVELVIAEAKKENNIPLNRNDEQCLKANETNWFKRAINHVKGLFNK